LTKGQSHHLGGKTDKKEKHKQNRKEERWVKKTKANRRGFPETQAGGGQVSKAEGKDVPLKVGKSHILN